MDNIPVAAARALQPDRQPWLAEARTMAQTILVTLAQPAERRFIPMFIARLAAGIFEGGLQLTMGTPFAALRDILSEAQAAAAVKSNADTGMGLFDLPVAEFEDLILKWVETPADQGGKRRDARDAGKSDEDIARLISYIMLSPNIGERGWIARTKLTPHIAAFLQKSQSDRLSDETVDLWLRAVLEGWREMVRARYPGFIRAELGAMKEELL